MARKLKPASQNDLDRVQNAIRHMKHAISELPSECPKAKAKLRSALKSAEGAERHMKRRVPTLTVIPRPNGALA